MSSKIQTQQGIRSIFKNQTFLASLGLFLLALLPRVYDLQRFVTADEAKWVYRSAQFLAALLRGDLAATSINLTPAVTTTWLGSIGLAAYYWLHQAAIGLPLVDWLAGLPEFRVELEVLAATRWPVVILTSLAVVAVYLLACRLFPPALAFLAAVFVALDPHYVALSRILGHDAPAAVFMTLAVLLLLLAAGESRARPPGRTAWWLLLLAGIAAGLAFLSKAPALFLIPFAGLLFLRQMWRSPLSSPAWFVQLVVWLAVAYLTFVIAWPAAWIEPLGRPWAVVENAFISATDQEEAEAEGYWLVPELGPAYYLVNGGFKLSPLVMIGAALAVVALAKRGGQARGQESSPFFNLSAFNPSACLWLLAFVLLFTLFMTVGDKRSARYILPAFPPLAILAAVGWLSLFHLPEAFGSVSRFKAQPASETQPAAKGTQATRFTFHVSERSLPWGRFTFQSAASLGDVSHYLFIALLTLCALVILLPYGPYYFTYFNPLLGGPYTAPRWVKIGWGEGLDRVGRFLQRENFRGSRVGTAYTSTVAPFFEGDLAAVTDEHLDYVALYTKQVQSGEPSPTFIRYFEHVGAIFSVDLNGIHYADVYPGPALQPSLALTPGLDQAILPKPTAFRPLTSYGRIGEKFDVDVVWLADEPLPAEPSTVTLEPPAALDFLSEDDHPAETARTSLTPTVLAQGQGKLSQLADHLIVSRHSLALPDDLEPGRYALRVDGRPLGEIELRRFQVPAGLQPVENFVFGQQIALAAYQFQPEADYIGLKIAWQAQTGPPADYTVFVQLIDLDTGERVAGIDTQPAAGAWPTSRWVKGEVVLDEYLLAVPPDITPGSYHVIAGLYRPETGQRLALADGRDYWTVPWTFMWED